MRTIFYFFLISYMHQNEIFVRKLKIILNRENSTKMLIKRHKKKEQLTNILNLIKSYQESGTQSQSTQSCIFEKNKK